MMDREEIETRMIKELLQLLYIKKGNFIYCKITMINIHTYILYPLSLLQDSLGDDDRSIACRRRGWLKLSSSISCAREGADEAARGIISGNDLVTIFSERAAAQSVHPCRMR